MKKKQVEPFREHSGSSPTVSQSSARATARSIPRNLQPFSPAELRQIGAEISAQCFRPIETRHLTLMAVDPWNLHVSWFVAAADLALARASLPGQGQGAVLLLRFTDASPGNEGMAAQSHFDVEVDASSHNWYVNLWRDARHYSAELGLRGADGTFICLVRSNEIVTPRAGPSPEFNFSERQVRAPDALQAVPLTQHTEVSDVLLRDLFPRWNAPQQDAYPVVVVSAEAAGNPLPEPAFPRMIPELPAIDVAPAVANDARGALLPGFATTVAATQPEPTGDFPFIAAADIASWHEQALNTRRQVLAAVATPMPALPQLVPGMVAPTDVTLPAQPLPFLSAAPPVLSLVPGSGPVPDAEADRVLPEDRLTNEQTHWRANDALVKPSMVAQAHAANHPCVALEALLTSALGSSAQRQYPVRAAAQLVIEGQAAPDTLLTLYGKPVPLQPGGQFSVQLPLPSGPDLAAVLQHWRSHLNGWRER